MRGAFVGVALTFALLAAGPAEAAYSGVTGGTASPATIGPAGATDYSVTLTGKAKPVDIVFVIDASGSMAMNMSGSGPPTREEAVTAATNSEIDALSNAGLFARGGTIAVVSFSDSATTGAAPTTDVAALKLATASIAPSGGGCLSCGIQRATDLLTAIPGAAGHKQIAYIVGDGNDNVAPAGTVAAATAASSAAHIERRAIGIPSGPITDLDSTDSGGAATYAGSTQALESAYGADPTSYPGANNISWVFHVAPGFSASAPSASVGTASVSGGDVTWMIPSLDAATATLSFHAVHSPASGCAATALLSGTTFSDAEGDSAPAAGLGTVTVSGCPPPISPPPATLRITSIGIHGSSIGARGGVTLTLVLNRAGTVKVGFQRKTSGRRVHGRCVAQTRANRHNKACTRFVAAGTLTRALKAGRQQIRLTRSVDGGHRLAPGTYKVLVLASGARTAAKTFTLKVHR